MSGLRWILLGAGVAFIAIVYLITRFQLSRRGASARRASGPDADVDLFDHIKRPIGDGFEDDEDVRRELERMARLVDETDDFPGDAPARLSVANEPVTVIDQPEAPAAAGHTGEDLIVLSVMAPSGHPFRGSALRAAFERAGLEFGEMDIYHRLTLVSGRRLPVFSVASAVKPGTFDPGAMENFSTPGLSLFLQLPAPVGGVEAFDDLINTAERLAAELGGVLRDREHHALNHQMLMQVRQQIASAAISPRRTAL